MKTITTNIARIGNFTSSEIHKLMSKGRAAGSVGKSFETYILEKNMERRLGRSIDDEVTARPLSWGHLMEIRVSDLLGLDYRFCSDETIIHPRIEYWAGSPDAEKFQPNKAAADVKCPHTLKSFCTLIDSFKSDGIQGIRDQHKDGDKFWWQLVSNAIILEADFAELIVYCPYKSELDELRKLAATNDVEDGDYNPFGWIARSQDEEIPHLLDLGHYENLNILRFEIPVESKKELTDRVILAGANLVER